MDPLTTEVARRIVERTGPVVGRNVNVMDERGLILASGDPARLRHRHEGALVAAERGSAVVIDADESRMLRGVQPGVNIPLHHRGVVVGVIGISGPPEEVRILADLIRVTAELILEQAVDLESGHRRQQAREELLTGLVTGRGDDASTARRAADLSIDLTVPRRCTVVRAAGEQEVEALRAVQWGVAALPDTLHARTDADELAVWWPADAHRVAEDVRRVVRTHADHLRVAEGRVVAGVGAVQESWRSALDTLAVADLAADLYEQRDLPFVALLRGLRDDRRAEEIAAPWRALEAADRHGELRATLRAWIEHDLHPGRCAAALHVHRNTLRGRLDRIERVTGLGVRRVPGLLQLYVGPLLAEVSRDDG